MQVLGWKEQKQVWVTFHKAEIYWQGTSSSRIEAEELGSLQEERDLHRFSSLPSSPQDLYPREEHLIGWWGGLDTLIDGTTQDRSWWGRGCPKHHWML